MKEVKERIQPTNNNGGKLLRVLLTSSVVISIGMFVKKVMDKATLDKKIKAYKSLKT